MIIQVGAVRERRGVGHGTPSTASCVPQLLGLDCRRSRWGERSPSCRRSLRCGAQTSSCWWPWGAPPPTLGLAPPWLLKASFCLGFSFDGTGGGEGVKREVRGKKGKAERLNMNVSQLKEQESEAESREGILFF